MVSQEQQTTISEEYTEIIRHALGLDLYRSKSLLGFRNYYCTVVGTSEFAVLKSMVQAGLMREGVKINDGRDQYFHVTEAGINAINLPVREKKRIKKIITLCASSGKQK